MLVNILKFTSSFLLCILLFTPITKREIKDFTEPEKQSPATTSVFIKNGGTTTVPNLLILQEGSTTPLLSSQSIITSKEIPAPSSIETKKTDNTQTKPIAYEPMVEHASDTDESYRPSISPCKVTLGYSIGSFDPRFGISKEEFIEEISKSAQIWENAADKKLFSYNPNGPLTINLIFDNRQASTVDIGYLALEIENAKASAEIIKNDYESEKNTYQLESELFIKDADAFNVAYKVYENKVLNYNKNGGVGRSEYDAMMLEFSELQKTADKLDKRQKELTLKTESINKKVARYNEFANYINTLIKKSNALGAKRFTEGRFTPSKATIDIYQFSDRTKLRRVIMHELGHVLGILHTKNAHSIMYSINAGTSTSLTNEDLTALKEACASE